MGSSPRKHASQGSSASPFFSSSCVTSSLPEAPCWDPDSVIKGNSKSQMCLRRIISRILHHSKKIPELPVVLSLNFAREPTVAQASALFEELKPSRATEVRVPASKSGGGCHLVDLNLRLGPLDAGEVPENVPIRRNVFATESDDGSTNPPSVWKASGEDNDAAASSLSQQSSSKRLWMLELCDGFEESAPVVRSKCGRNQTPPSRYSDSVLDPWKLFSL